MEHNIVVQALGMLATAVIGSVGTWFFGRKSGTGFLMGQGRSRISGAVNRSNTRDQHQTDAENIVLASAKLTQEELKEARTWEREAIKQLVDMNYRLGKAEGKAELLEKQASSTDIKEEFFKDDMTANSTFPEAVEAFSDGTTAQDSVFPEQSLKETANDLEVLPKEQRKKHLLTEKRDELENNRWDIQPLGGGSEKTPVIEPAPLQTINPLDHPIVMSQADIDHYGEVAKRAQRLALEANQRLQTYQIEGKPMNHVFQNPKTSVAGVVAALPLLGMAASFFVSGDLVSGFAHALAGIGVLIGLLQASDAKTVAETISSIVPKPQTPPTNPQ